MPMPNFKGGWKNTVNYVQEESKIVCWTCSTVSLSVLLWLGRRIVEFLDFCSVLAFRQHFKKRDAFYMNMYMYVCVCVCTMTNSEKQAELTLCHLYSPSSVLPPKKPGLSYLREFWKDVRIISAQGKPIRNCGVYQWEIQSWKGDL